MLPVTIPALDIHRFDERRLAAYLQHELPGFGGDCAVRQFQGGQSNPTFLISSGDRQYVLRKKPPGDLLPSAHAVDREFTVLQALASTGVPVPKVYLLCRDVSVVGQMFYVMEHVEGRVFSDLVMPGATPSDRSSVTLHLAQVLADLHAVDIASVGLSDFGRPDGYVKRQIARWSKQYAASGLDAPSMASLMAWLPDHIPPGDSAAVTHGDYRVGNTIIHPSNPSIAAVLDWELATIGHPLADLAYSCLPYRLPSVTGRGFADVDVRELGLPTEAEYVSAYCRRTGTARLEQLEFFVAFSLFRLAAIIAGVYRRGLDGNAADRNALEIGRHYSTIADLAWHTAQSISSPARRAIQSEA